jgi:predicted nucleic acid-binding protein
LRYLFDTCIVSELIKTKKNPNILAWISRIAVADIYMSAITIAEIRKGIELVRPENEAAALRYETWLTDLILHHRDRILPFDEAAAQIWGRLMAQLSLSGGKDPERPALDVQIAAIAIHHGMTVVTRNVKAFQPFSVPIINPF